MEETEEAYINLRAFLREKDPTLTDSELVKRINNDFESVVKIMLSKHSCERLIRILEKATKLSMIGGDN